MHFTGTNFRNQVDWFGMGFKTGLLLKKILKCFWLLCIMGKESFPLIYRGLDQSIIARIKQN